MIRIETGIWLKSITFFNLISFTLSRYRSGNQFIRRISIFSGKYDLSFTTITQITDKNAFKLNKSYKIIPDTIECVSLND